MPTTTTTFFFTEAEAQAARNGVWPADLGDVVEVHWGPEPFVEDEVLRRADPDMVVWRAKLTVRRAAPPQTWSSERGEGAAWICRGRVTEG